MSMVLWPQTFTRVRSSPASATDPYSYDQAGSAGPTTGTAVTFSLSNTTRDSPTSGYLKRAKDGAIICTDFERLIEEHHNPLGSLESEWNNGDNWFSGTYENPNRPMLTFSPPTSSMLSRAVTNCYARVNSSDWQSMVSVAEAGKTVDTFASYLKDAVGLIRACKRGQFSNAWRRMPKWQKIKRMTGTVRDQWLRYRYGIRPLMYEVSAATDAFAALQAKGPPRRTFRGKASPYEHKSTGGFTTSNQWGVRNYAQSIDGIATAYAGALCDLPLDQSGQEYRAFGHDEFLSSAWELVPFSFVVDWFTNTGDWLSALEGDHNVRMLCSWATLRVQSTSEVHYVNLEPSQLAVSSGFSETRIETSNKRVDNLYRFANPPLQALPRINIRLDALKGIDLVALFGKKPGTTTRGYRR